MSSLQDILRAASILSEIGDADKEILLPYRTKLEPAFHRLQALLQPNAHQQPTRSTPIAPESNDRREIHSIELLLRFLERDRKEYIKLTAEPPTSFLSKAVNWMAEDPRIVDFVSLAEPKGKLLDERFRGGLSMISLTDEYLEWEERIYGSTRADRIFDDLTSASDWRDSHYKEFIEDRSDQLRDKARAQRCIEYGIKYRVFHKLYCLRLAVQSEHDNTIDKGIGILGILLPSVSHFRRVKYDDLPYLANAILSSKWRDDTQKQEKWTAQCLAMFDSQVRSIIQSRKRASKDDFFVPEKRARITHEDNILLENQILPIEDPFNMPETQSRHETAPSLSRFNPLMQLILPDVGGIDSSYSNINEASLWNSSQPLQDMDNTVRHLFQDSSYLGT